MEEFSRAYGVPLILNFVPGDLIKLKIFMKSILLRYHGKVNAHFDNNDVGIVIYMNPYTRDVLIMSSKTYGFVSAMYIEKIV